MCVISVELIKYWQVSLLLFELYGLVTSFFFSFEISLNSAARGLSLKQQPQIVVV